jgi:hypothetical protein
MKKGVSLFVTFLVSLLLTGEASLAAGPVTTVPAPAPAPATTLKPNPLKPAGTTQPSTPSTSPVASASPYVAPSDGGGQGLWVGRSDGIKFITNLWTRWTTTPWMEVLVGDFNGDGKTDVMKFDVSSSGSGQNGLWVGCPMAVSSIPVNGPHGRPPRGWKSSLGTSTGTARRT